MFDQLLIRSLLEQRQDLAVAASSPYIQEGFATIALVFGLFAAFILKLARVSSSLMLEDFRCFGANTLFKSALAATVLSMVTTLPFGIPVLMFIVAFMLAVGCLIGSGIGGIAVVATNKSLYNMRRRTHLLPYRALILSPMLVLLSSKGGRRTAGIGLAYCLGLCLAFNLISYSLHVVIDGAIILALIAMLSSPAGKVRRRLVRRMYLWSMMERRLATPT